MFDLYLLWGWYLCISFDNLKLARFFNDVTPFPFQVLQLDAGGDGDMKFLELGDLKNLTMLDPYVAGQIQLVQNLRGWICWGWCQDVAHDFRIPEMLLRMKRECPPSHIVNERCSQGIFWYNGIFAWPEIDKTGLTICLVSSTRKSKIVFWGNHQWPHWHCCKKKLSSNLCVSSSRPASSGILWLILQVRPPHATLPDWSVAPCFIRPLVGPTSGTDCWTSKAKAEGLGCQLRSQMVAASSFRAIAFDSFKQFCFVFLMMLGRIALDGPVMGTLRDHPFS